MNRRRFLWGGSTLVSLGGLQTRIRPGAFPAVALAADQDGGEANPNWADPALGAQASASSHILNPPWNHVPKNVFGDFSQTSWETESESSGAWLEVTFPEPRPIRELWILAKPLPYDLVLDPYMRGGHMATPRKITLTFDGGTPHSVELRQEKYFQIVTLLQERRARTLRITIQDVREEPGKRGTGLGKIKVFPRPHLRTFELTVHPMYDVRDGAPAQTATLQAANPGEEIVDAQLEISHQGKVLATLPLQPIPAGAVVNQDLWIPAPYDDAVMEFRVVRRDTVLPAARRLNVPAYRSYFDGGTFNFLCTNHNDLGWLDTQAVTADYRSAELILPAMRLLKANPEYRYSMESVAYLIEFLERHPEKEEEMAQYMREGRFTWGASYIQNLEAHVGPEKLVRQFYLGRRWLKKNFPGADTHFYFKTDPPGMTLQMPQILAKAGIKYIVQGRFPWGFYNWRAPDGSRVFMFAFRYTEPKLLPNPKNNHGWLSYATAREYYYAPRQLPPIFIFDFNSDYLPPAAELVPYVRAQNEAMQRFAAKWNEHPAVNPAHQIKPPEIRFVEPEAILDELTSRELNIESIQGDWPMAWAYYDEPSNREALHKGRLGHNALLGAERLHAALMSMTGSRDYPHTEIAEAWKANCWPDHGWGGNRGVETDAVYAESYKKSKELAEKLLRDAGAKAARWAIRTSSTQRPVVVFNPLSWARTDGVTCRLEAPGDSRSLVLRDDAGKEIPHQLTEDGTEGSAVSLIFVAEDVPPVGYRTFYLEPSASALAGEKPLTGNTLENGFLRVGLGRGGLESVYDKRRRQEVLRTGKFFGGEVLQFAAPGLAWQDLETVTLDDFDRTSDHPFPVVKSVQGAVRSTIVREAKFRRFLLREHLHLYSRLDRVEIGLEVLDWDGEKERELRVAFPINLDDAQLSYEVPFGTVEIGKDEIDFSLLPPSPDTNFIPRLYGAYTPLRFREAVNWIDASAHGYLGFGCLAASDCTVHVFRDETSRPVSYPVLQHVLLSTRKSLAWNPEYWYTQAGSHRYRLALYPHAGNWRLRYRDGIAFNYPLVAFIGPEGAAAVSPSHSLPASATFLRLEPTNLILTAMKKSEDDDSLALRFYEAEGRAVHASLHLFRPVKQAWRTSLIEDEPEPLSVPPDGSLRFPVKPWEIVTLKVAC